MISGGGGLGINGWGERFVYSYPNNFNVSILPMYEQSCNLWKSKLNVDMKY